MSFRSTLTLCENAIKAKDLNLALTHFNAAKAAADAQPTGTFLSFVAGTFGTKIDEGQVGYTPLDTP